MSLFPKAFFLCQWSSQFHKNIQTSLHLNLSSSTKYILLSSEPNKAEILNTELQVKAPHGKQVHMKRGLGTLWLQMPCLTIMQRDHEVWFCTVLGKFACSRERWADERQTWSLQLHGSHASFKIDYDCEECLQTHALIDSRTVNTSSSLHLKVTLSSATVAWEELLFMETIQFRGELWELFS